IMTSSCSGRDPAGAAAAEPPSCAAASVGKPASTRSLANSAHARVDIDRAKVSLPGYLDGTGRVEPGTFRWRKPTHGGAAKGVTSEAVAEGYGGAVAAAELQR